MTASESPTMIQVTNIAPQASVHQMNELFGFLGDVHVLKLFPQE